MSEELKALDIGEIDEGQFQDQPLSVPPELPILPLRDTVLFPNSFMPLAVARAQALSAGITINGLAISRPGSTRPFRGISLEAHFARDVVGGPGAFVVTVDETISFADAVIKKLVLEIAGTPQAPVQLGERR